MAVKLSFPNYRYVILLLDSIVLISKKHIFFIDSFLFNPPVNDSSYKSQSCKMQNNIVLSDRFIKYAEAELYVLRGS